MRLKAVLLALALGAITAAGAAAEGGPGPGGGHPGPPPGGKPSGPPPPGTPPPPKGSPGGTEGADHPAAGGEHAFRAQLTALGYTCLHRPVLVRGALTAVGTGSLTVHATRPAEHGHPAVAVDVVVKVISTTQFRRAGHAGPAARTDLVVKDMVEVHAAACRIAGAATGTPPTLIAGMVNARPARASTAAEKP